MTRGSALLLAAVLPVMSWEVKGQESPAAPVPTRVAVPALRPIDVETHTPMYIITRSDLQRMGELGLGEVLQRLPFMGRSAPNLNSNAAGDGAVIADIGGMGPARCIVMMNGQRLPVSELLGAPAVDLDTIPIASIDRVEIFLGGASPAWGADAVAGVINIITRPETQGTDVTLASGLSSRGDGQTSRLSVFKGEVFGRGHVNFTAELRKEDPIQSAARAFSATSETLGCTSGPGCVWPSGSTATANGLFEVPSGNALGLPAGSYTFDTPGQWRPFQATGADNDLYSTQTDTFLRDGRTGGSIVGSLGYDLTDRTELTVDVLASDDRVDRQLAPLPLSISMVNSPPGGGPVPIAEAPSATLTPSLPSALVLLAGNSFYNPFRVPLTDVRVRLVELGPRSLVDRSNTEMLSSSLDHSGDEWDWKATFSAARSAISEWDSATVDSSSLAEALGPSGPDASGVIRCGTPQPPAGIVTDPIPGCVPLDLFDGPAAITPAMLDYVTVPSSGGETQLHLQLSLIARRSLVIDSGLPPARLAIGLESQRTTEDSDPDSSTDQPFVTTSTPTGGTVSEQDLLAELSWPFKSSSGGGSAATLTTGARIAWAAQYAPVPVGFAAIEWRPDPELLLRSRFTQVYRPPTAGELFLGYQERVVPVGNPCGPGEVASSFCAAALGTPGVNAVSAASESDYFIAGNPDLRPERGFNAGTGLVWNSLVHPMREVSLDLTWVRLNDAIVAPSAPELIGACEDGTSVESCGRIASIPGSNIYAVNGSLINGGLDESIRADLKAGDALNTGMGELRGELLAGYLLRRRITDISGQDINLRGTFDLTEGITGTAYPIVLSRAQLAWKRGSWALHWTTDFIGSYRETVDPNGLPTSVGGEVHTVGSTIYHDATLEHTWGSLASLRFSVENVFDHQPPFVNDAIEDNTDSATYRLEGRVFSLTLELTF